MASSSSHAPVVLPWATTPAPLSVQQVVLPWEHEHAAFPVDVETYKSPNYNLGEKTQATPEEIADMMRFQSGFGAMPPPDAASSDEATTDESDESLQDVGSQAQTDDGEAKRATPWGWIALGVAAGGLAVYALFRGSGRVANPIDVEQESGRDTDFLPYYKAYAQSFEGVVPEHHQERFFREFARAKAYADVYQKEHPSARRVTTIRMVGFSNGRDAAQTDRGVATKVAYKEKFGQAMVARDSIIHQEQEMASAIRQDVIDAIMHAPASSKLKPEARDAMLESLLWTLEGQSAADFAVEKGISRDLAYQWKRRAILLLKKVRPDLVEFLESVGHRNQMLISKDLKTKYLSSMGRFKRPVSNV